MNVDTAPINARINVLTQPAPMPVTVLWGSDSTLEIGGPVMVRFKIILTAKGFGVTGWFDKIILKFKEM